MCNMKSPSADQLKDVSTRFYRISLLRYGALLMTPSQRLGFLASSKFIWLKRCPYNSAYWLYNISHFGLLYLYRFRNPTEIIKCTPALWNCTLYSVSATSAIQRWCLHYLSRASAHRNTQSNEIVHEAAQYINNDNRLIPALTPRDLRIHLFQQYYN